MQPARLMLLHHPGLPLAGGRGLGGHGLRRAGGRAHAAVLREPVGRRVERGDAVPVALEPLEHLLVLELLEPARLHLVPRAGGRDGRPQPPAQRVGRDGRLRGRVLAPIDQHLAAPQRLLHVADDLVRVHLLERARQLVRHLARLLARHRAVEPRVEVDALRAARERERLEPDVDQELPHPQRHPRAVVEVGALARVEVEHQSVRVGALAVDRTPLRHVQLERPHLRHPRERPGLGQQRVLLGPGRVPLLDGLDPVGRTLLERLLEEQAAGLARRADPVGPPLARDGAAGCMGDEGFGCAKHVLEHVALGRPGRRVQHLVAVREAQRAPADGDALGRRHVRRTSAWPPASSQRTASSRSTASMPAS